MLHAVEGACALCTCLEPPVTMARITRHLPLRHSQRCTSYDNESCCTACVRRRCGAPEFEHPAGKPCLAWSIVSSSGLAAYNDATDTAVAAHIVFCSISASLLKVWPQSAVRPVALLRPDSVTPSPTPAASPPNTSLLNGVPNVRDTPLVANNLIRQLAVAVWEYASLKCARAFAGPWAAAPFQAAAP